MATNLSAEELSGFESRLMAMRDELQARIAAEQKEIEQFTQDQADEFISQHNADLATDVFETERAIGTKIAAESELEAVEQALERLKAGSYGICVQCGQPIPKERLEARPQAIRCLKDEQLWEASGRRA
jgi:RNA polymerase-binding protein DksA